MCWICVQKIAIKKSCVLKIPPIFKNTPTLIIWITGYGAKTSNVRSRFAQELQKAYVAAMSTAKCQYELLGAYPRMIAQRSSIFGVPMGF